MRMTIAILLKKVYREPWLVFLGSLLVVMLWGTGARAQRAAFSLDRIQVGGSPNDGFAVWRPRMSHKSVFFGQWAVGYQRRPLRAQTAAFNDTLAAGDRTDDPVKNVLTTYLTAGIEVLDRASFSASIPVTLYQNGNSPCSDPHAPSTCQDTDIDPTSPGDTRLDARVIAWRDKNRRYHFGLAGSVFIPSGRQVSFTGDGQTHGMVQALGEIDFKPFVLTLNTGVHFRPYRGLNRLRIGDEWTWGAGAFLPMRDGRIRLGGELFGSTGIGHAGEPDKIAKDTNTTFTKRNTPLEWMAELRLALGKKKNTWAMFGGGSRMSAGYGAPDLRLLATLGYRFEISDVKPKSPGRRYVNVKMDEPTYSDRDKDGIPDDLDACPDVKEDGQEPDASDGCPAAADADHDGIPDDADQCPQEPEDKDGIDDQDGCPEDDFDQDGVLDAEDKCPREPGEVNTEEPEKNGCPKFIRRIEGSSEIQILKRVEFATGSSRILSRSFPILDEVVALLQANPGIKKVSVEGHTDSRGAHDMNMRLSDARAASVKKYLIQHGISADRLTSHGYGPDKPIDTNDTAEGRQRNRRVEFHIVEQDD